MENRIHYSIFHTYFKASLLYNKLLWIQQIMHKYENYLNNFKNFLRKRHRHYTIILNIKDLRWNDENVIEFHEIKNSIS